MAALILIDSNIPMYLVGAEHPHKAGARKMLDRCIQEDERLVTDAEVLQEILHRYIAIKRRDAIQPAFDALLTVVDEVFAVDRGIMEEAKRIAMENPQLSARDALHLSVMERHGIERIMSFDADFDGYPGVRRLSA